MKISKVNMQTGQGATPNIGPPGNSCPLNVPIIGYTVRAYKISRNPRYVDKSLLQKEDTKDFSLLRKYLF